jgi:hypothetical protein
MRSIVTAGVFMLAVHVYAEGAWMSCTNSGAEVWNPDPQPGESVQWEGAVTNGKAVGPGTVSWLVNGAVTEHVRGDWKAGKIEGHGVWIHSAGDAYEGQWAGGMRQGYGIYAWRDGHRFMGLYENNTRAVGRLFGPDGKPLALIPTPVEREAMFCAQDAAIAARKAAVLAELTAKRYSSVKHAAAPVPAASGADEAPADK